jgi:hypothetical protein
MPTRGRRRGVAMFLVVAAIAIAAVLGLVMLATATLANQSGGNQQKMVSTEYLGESGMNLAMYYLQHPPSGDPLVYWTGTNGPIAIGSGGTVDVTVAPATDSSNAVLPWTYEVTCTATAGVVTPISRVYRARMYVRNEFTTKWAAAFNTDVAFQPGAVIVGDVYTYKSLATLLQLLGVSINGKGYAASFNNTLPYSLLGGTFLPQPPLGSAATIQAPSVTDLNLYKTYTFNGVMGKAATLASSSLSGNLSPDNTGANPGQVFYYDAATTALTLGDGATINGTLVVDHGDLLVRGQNIKITPSAGMPALIVYRNIVIDQPSKSITANGVVFYGGSLMKGQGLTPPLPTNYSTFTIKGALLSGATGATAPFATGYNIRTYVTYDSTLAKAPDITTNPVLKHATGVSMLRWGAP